MILINAGKMCKEAAQITGYEVEALYWLARKHGLHFPGRMPQPQAGKTYRLGKHRKPSTEEQRARWRAEKQGRARLYADTQNRPPPKSKRKNIEDLKSCGFSRTHYVDIEFDFDVKDSNLRADGRVLKKVPQA